MRSQDESHMVRRAQRGDREALGLLWDTLTPKLFGYLVNTLRDRPLAEDILQTTWLKAIKALPNLKKNSARISPWLFKIARNECLQHWRRSGRETPLDLQEHDKAQDDHENIDEKALVEQLLAHVSADDREILRLRYIADLPMKDISEVLSISAVAVRVRIHRALARAKAAHLSQLS